MKLATAQNSKRPGAQRRGQALGFTLMECLVALTFLAIVIPVVVEALHVASGAGSIAARKSAAARVAQRVLDESIVMTNWNGGQQSGTVNEGPDQFSWTLDSQSWQQQSAMKLVTAQVTFNTQGRAYTVKLSTLAAPTAQTTPVASTGTTTP
jgi:type II secretory pathway pseudopilin PulG